MLTVHCLIWLSIGTSTPSVTTRAQIIKTKPATARANAVERFGSSISMNAAESRESGIRNRMGTARLRIAV